MFSLSIFSILGVLYLKERKEENQKDEIKYQHPWDIKDFKQKGYQMIDFMCDYYENIEKKDVLSKVEPGYLSKLIPKEAPKSIFIL